MFLRLRSSGLVLGQLSSAISLGSPEIAPFYTLLKDKPDNGLRTTTRQHLSLSWKADWIRRVSLVKQSADSGIHWYKVHYHEVQIVEGEENARDLISLLLFFLFWSSPVILLFVKCSNQICQNLRVRELRSICWDHLLYKHAVHFSASYYPTQSERLLPLPSIRQVDQ